MICVSYWVFSCLFRIVTNRKYGKGEGKHACKGIDSIFSVPGEYTIYGLVNQVSYVSREVSRLVSLYGPHPPTIYN